MMQDDSGFFAKQLEKMKWPLTYMGKTTGGKNLISGEVQL